MVNWIELPIKNKVYITLTRLFFTHTRRISNYKQLILKNVYMWHIMQIECMHV